MFNYPYFLQHIICKIIFKKWIILYTFWPDFVSQYFVNHPSWTDEKFNYCLLFYSMLLLLLLSHFSHVRLCVTPQTAAHRAPPSLGFSRQEHWSGLPFPSPMHESEKWKWSHSVMSDPQRPHGLQPTRLTRPWDSPGKNSGVGWHFLLEFYSIDIP